MGRNKLGYSGGASTSVLENEVFRRIGNSCEGFIWLMQNEICANSMR